MRVLHYLHSNSYGQAVAHCLDLDLVATGADSDVALRRSNAVVKAQVENALASGNYTVLNTPAPQEYWDWFFAGDRLPNSKLEIRVPQVVPIERALSSLGVIAAKAHAAAA